MRCFLDTNIVVYANDASDPRKQALALDTVVRHMRERSGTISTQVLQEYAVVAVKKLKQAVPVVVHQLHLLESLSVVQISPGLVRRALEVQQIHGLSYWDSLILSAGESAACDTLLTEDLDAGSFYCGMICKNPFAED